MRHAWSCIITRIFEEETINSREFQFHRNIIIIIIDIIIYACPFIVENVHLLVIRDFFVSVLLTLI